MPLKRCKFCGKEVEVPAYRAKTFKYCSRRCLGKASCMPHELICPVCGKSFTCISSRANKAKYCSRKCYYKAMHLMGSVVMYCKTCGKEFRTSPSHKRIFCCKECKAQHYHNKPCKTFKAIRDRFKKRGLINACSECGYSLHPEILGIHHIDGNHDNNTLSNLQVLCPNCHSLKHKKHVVHGGTNATKSR